MAAPANADNGNGNNEYEHCTNTLATDNDDKRCEMTYDIYYDYDYDMARPPSQIMQI